MLEVANLVVQAATSGSWATLIGLIVPILWIGCAYGGVANRNQCLVQTFSWCAFLCAAVGLLGVGVSWWSVDTEKRICAGEIKPTKDTQPILDHDCDGSNVKHAIIVGAIIGTVFGIVIALIQCVGGYASWNLLNKGSSYFTQAAAPVSGAVVGAPVYITAQSAPQVYVVDAVVAPPA